MKMHLNRVDLDNLRQLFVRQISRPLLDKSNFNFFFLKKILLYVSDFQNN